jgi:hypothetical protein
MHDEAHAGPRVHAAWAASATGRRLEPPPLPAGASHAHLHGTSARRRSSRRALRAALAVALTTLGLMLVLGWGYTTALRGRVASADERVARQQEALAAAEQELVTLRAERDALASGRLPGLIPIEFDRAIEIDRQYVRNVIFTETGTRDAHRYEYRLVAENASPSVLRPAVRLIFFDGRGVQIGESIVDRDALGATGGVEAWLQPGETRSYTAVVGLADDAAPRYFLLSLE